MTRPLTEGSAPRCRPVRAGTATASEIWHLPKGLSMRVELLQHAGCRAAPSTHQLVQQCLTALDVHTPVLVRVGDYPSCFAVLRWLPGS